MRLVMAQIEPVTGDLEGNTSRILSVIEEHGSSSDLILFPEMAVTGYNCGADFESEEFIADARHCIEARILPHVKSSHVILGAPTMAHPRHEANGNIRIHNSALLLHNQMIRGVYHKRFLANDSHHEDRKYFIPGKDEFLVFHVAGHLFGVLICEDMWAQDHERNLMADMKAAYPALDAIMVINYSYFTYTKQPFRLELLTHHSKSLGIGMVYLNAVGIGDIVKNIICYDGGSWAVTSKGDVAARLPEFKEAVEVVDYSPHARCEEPADARQFGDKCSRIWGALCFTTRRMFDIPGIPKAQVHVSGGLDSAIVAALAVDSLGPERTILITNPSRYSGDNLLSTGRHLADALCMPLHTVAVENFSTSLLKDMDEDAVRSGETKLPSEIPLVRSTIDAVGRTVIGLAECHYNHSSVLATGNHTENVLGWATFHDVGSIGLFQPIGDLTKMELFKLAEWINESHGREIIPASLYNGTIKPAAELADANEDPFDYFLVSGICAELIRHRKTRRQLYTAWKEHTLTEEYFPNGEVYNYPEEVWQQNVDLCWKRSRTSSVFKCAQAAPVLIISPRSRGFSSRETIITRYFG